MPKTLTVYQDVQRVTESKKVEYDLPLILKSDCDDEPEFIWIKTNLSAIYIKKNKFNSSRSIKAIANFDLETDDHNIDLRTFRKTSTADEFNNSLKEALTHFS
jgi:hypothetical protein